MFLYGYIRWFERLLATDYVVIALTVLTDRSDKQPRSFFFKVFAWLDYQLFARTTQPNAFHQSDVSNLLSGVSILKTTEKKHLESFKLDVLLDFRQQKTTVLSTDVARLGIWSIIGSDPETHGYVSDGYWETSNTYPVTGVTLLMQQSFGKQPRVLYRSWSSTHPISPHVTRNHTYWKASLCILRVLDQRQRLGEDAFLKRLNQNNGALATTANQQYPIPNNWQALGMLARYIKAITKKYSRKRFIKTSGFYCTDLSKLVLQLILHRSSGLCHPRDTNSGPTHTWFFIEGRWYIFLEELMTGAAKAHISVMELTTDGQYTKPVRILEKPYHLSYPFVFQWQNTYYMIPETMDNRTIELYRCTQFPGNWEFVMNLMANVQAVDTTLVHHNGKWWLFTAMTEIGNLKPWDELYVFYADELLTNQWTPHPLNPVVSDVRRARPAGKIFQHQGNLYRPSQNSSRRYGYGLNINQITSLTEEHYQETEISSVEPNWSENLNGVHSYSHDQGLTVIDGFWWTHK